MTTKSTRQRILTERGLHPVQAAKGKHRRLKTIPSVVPDDSKTSLMLLLEIRHREPIENLLTAGSGPSVAKHLGINKGCVSKWIKRLKLREENDG